MSSHVVETQTGPRQWHTGSKLDSLGATVGTRPVGVTNSDTSVSASLLIRRFAGDARCSPSHSAPQMHRPASGTCPAPSPRTHLRLLARTRSGRGRLIALRFRNGLDGTFISKVDRRLLICCDRGNGIHAGELSAGFDPRMCWCNSTVSLWMACTMRSASRLVS